MSCIKGSNPFVSAKQPSHPCGGFFFAPLASMFLQRLQPICNSIVDVGSDANVDTANNAA